MKRIAFVLLLVIGLVSCGKGGKEPETANSAAQPTSQTPASSQEKSVDSVEEFKFQFVADCGSQNRDNCPGGYGFALDSQGLFVVGPGPRGQRVEGQLTAEEMVRFRKLSLSTNLASLPQSQETCLEEGGDSALYAKSGDESISLLKNGISVAPLIRSSSKSVCFRGMLAQEAGAFREFFRDIVARHYPLPFPDHCQDAVVDYRVFEAPLANCTVDADCAYVDEQFKPLELKEYLLLNMTSCRVVQAPVVANRAYLLQNQEQISIAYNRVWSACGSASISRDDCAIASGFRVVTEPAVCRQNVCRPANPLQ